VPTNQEILQNVGQTRYGLDLPGAMRRAIIANGGNPLGRTGKNGLAGIICNSVAPVQFPTNKPVELGRADVFANVHFFLAAAPAP
jgi:hypothetical protein